MNEHLYRSRPQTVEAIQWTGFNIDEVCDFVDVVNTGVIDYGPSADDGREHPLLLEAGKDGAQGWVPVLAGHWIVRSQCDMNDHWPVDPVYFAAKYEKVDADE